MEDDCGRKRRAAPLLFLLASEVSKWQPMVAGGVVRPLAVKASSGGIPATGELSVQVKAGQVSGRKTLDVGSIIPEMVGCLLFFST